MEQIAASIQQNGEDGEVVQQLKGLVCQAGLNLGEWRDGTTNLNLFQLAVLHRNKGVVKYLLSQGMNFMQKKLYWVARAEDKTSVAKSLVLVNDLQSLASEQTAAQKHPTEQPIQNEPQIQQQSLQQPSVQSTPLVGTNTPAQQQSQQQPPVQSTPLVGTNTPAQQQSQQQPSIQPTPLAGTNPPAQQQSEQQPPHTQAAGKEEGEEGLLVNHPLHLACWLGDVDLVKLLTEPALPARGRKRPRSHQDVPPHAGENGGSHHHGVPLPTAEKGEGQGIPPLLDQKGMWEELQDLMKSVSVVNVAAGLVGSKKSFVSPTSIGTTCQSSEDFIRGRPVEQTVKSGVRESQLSSEESVQGLPVDLALLSGNVKCLKYLMSSVVLCLLSHQSHWVGMKRKVVDLHLACVSGAPTVAALLLPTFSSKVINNRDSIGQTPLHFAVWNGDTETIRLLLEHGADVKECTDTASSCLHILYRSRMKPYNYEANTGLLLSYGADVNGLDSVCDIGTGLSPLHVIIEELMGATRHSVLLWKLGAARRMSVYTQCIPQAEPPPSLSHYLQELLRCLRLVLEAGADPNLPDSNPKSGKTALELILSGRKIMLAKKESEVLFTATAMLLEYGATLPTPHGNTHLVFFLLNHLPQLPDGNTQARFIQLFCLNGVSGEAICCHLHTYCAAMVVNYWFTWHPECLTALIDWTPLHALRYLPQVLQHLRFPEQDSKSACDLEVPALYGSPVRSLRHMCKVVVLGQLGCWGKKIESLTLPPVVKSYLRDDYF